MPLVNAKCTNCGATLEIDSAKDAVICPHCSSAFIAEKAINYYNTTLVTNVETLHAEVVNIAESNQLETLIKSGETFLQFNDFTSAEKAFRKVTEVYPYDYRGWWGRIVCKTKGFLEPILKNNELNEWFGRVKQLISGGECVLLEKQYVEYLKTVSCLAAKKDIEVVSSKIADYQLEIQELEGKNQYLHQSIQENKTQYESQVKNINEQVWNAKTAIREVKEKRTKIVWGGIIAEVAILVICILLLRILGALGSLVVIGVEAIVIITAGKAAEESGKNLNRKISEAQHVLSTETAIRRTCKLEYSKKNDELNHCVEEHKKEIEMIEIEKEKYQRYLGIGEDKIKDYWFSIKCGEIGIVQPIDEVVKECREGALGSTIK